MPCNELLCLTLIHSNRRALFEDLCRFHENGVRHGDLRPSNVAIRTMLYRLLLCDCEGPNSCEELIEARHFLFLGETE
jgi:tRNA A-37 threonylcarbamoyl transferase component Bud32